MKKLTDPVCSAVTGSWDSAIDTDTYDTDLVCYISANTAGGNCQDYCVDLGRVCINAQDNVGHKNGGTNDDGSCGIGEDFTTNGDDFATGDGPATVTAPIH